MFALFCRPQLITGTENLLVEFKGWAFLISGIDSAIDVFHARSTPEGPVDLAYLPPTLKRKKGQHDTDVSSETEEPETPKDWTYLPPTPATKRLKVGHVSFGPSCSSFSSVPSDPRECHKDESVPQSEKPAHKSPSPVLPATPKIRPVPLPKTTPRRRDLVDE